MSCTSYHLGIALSNTNLAVANNFWGKDDAGVQPLLERMQNAKVTCDELKAFYNSKYIPEGPMGNGKLIPGSSCDH